MANTALNRSGVQLLTNKSGGAVAQGDVVIIDTTTASSFTTTTTTGFSNTIIGVVVEPNGITNDAVGLVAFSGYVPKVTLDGAAALGDLIKTDTVAKQGTPHASPLVAGDFGVVLGTGATPEAVLWGYPDQGAGVAGGAADPTSDFFAYGSANQTGISTTPTKVQFNTEVRDTGSDYDHVTNFRWTPPAGVVDMYAQLQWTNFATGDHIIARIHKNGSLVARKAEAASTVGGNFLEVCVSFRDVANGTDYYEVFAYSSATNDIVGVQNGSFFFGTLLKW